VIIRLYHADKTVRQELAEAVRGRPGLLLATQLQGPRNLAMEGRTPFKEILDCAGKALDLLAIIDEGKPEGMWRDPFGELCDRLFSERRDAAAATSGYVLLRGGQALAFFRKALWDPLEDVEEVTTYLSRIAPGQVRLYERPKPKPTDPPRPQKPKPKKTPIINAAAGAPAAYSSSAKTTTEMPLPSVMISPDLMTPSKVAPKAAGDPAKEPATIHPTLGDDDDATAVETSPLGAAAPHLREEDTNPGVFEIPEDLVPPPLKDPWEVIGVQRGLPLDDAKKAYHALIQQYHPDKVSHLAPEFRKIAEERTREINEAYRLIEKELEKK
jgi:hypothetical protein